MFRFVLLSLCLLGTRSECPPVWLNEIHYDNSGADTGEFLELAGQAGTDLAGWSVQLINGGSNPPSKYSTIDLSGTIADDTGSAFGFVVLEFNGIQNGAPDGVAIVDDSNNIVQFLSYEGEITFDGVMSQPIGVEESSSTPVGYSLQLTGAGTCYADFTWSEAAPETRGKANNNQELGDGPAPPTAAPTIPTFVDATIQQIQGAGSESPLAGTEVEIRSVYVTAIESNGFFVQEKVDSGEPGMVPSSGLFVFERNVPTAISIGQELILQGTVSEFFGWTQLSLTSFTIVDSVPFFFEPVRVEMPVLDTTFLENLESMLVDIVPMDDSIVVVSEYFNLDRFGTIVVCAADAAKGRLFQYTQLNEPSVEGYREQLDLLDRSCLVVDDGRTTSNPDPILVGGIYNLNDIVLRGGSEITSLRGPLIDDRFSSYYRVQPYSASDFAISTKTNPRPEGLDVRARRKEVSIVSTNVLNFFTTLVDPPARGADNAEEYNRQRAKMLTALENIDADVVVVVEIENSIGILNGEAASRALAEGLSAQLSKRSYASVAVQSGILQIGFQSIKVDIIYDTNKLDLVDAATLDDTQVDAARLEAAGDAIFGTSEENSGNSRVPLMATFKERRGSGKNDLTIVANHFKSKGSPCNEDENAPEDGTGRCDQVRTQSSLALLDWIESNPTGYKSNNIVIAGDLNSYAKEAPITTLLDNGFVSVEDLDKRDPPVYSYLFNGQFGTLDYILVHSDVIDKVGNAVTWHVNADEPDAIDYNLDFGRPRELFDASTPYRFSDHDPLIITMDL